MKVKDMMLQNQSPSEEEDPLDAPLDAPLEADAPENLE
jgi:hypothetical protein